MGAVDKVLDYRLNIHEEFQGWILLFASVTCVFFFCLPCYCAGLSCTAGRRFAAWINRNMRCFYAFITIFNLVFMYLLCTWLPDWDFPQYMALVLKTLNSTIQHLVNGASSIAIIVAFVFAVTFKDRIAQLFGFDHKTLFRFKVRDCMNCLGPSRFRPIEISVWKVEDLASADPFTANNVFVEFFLGYNEPLATRVHNNAGSGCLMKQTLQLNFDEHDDDDTLFVFVKNQKVMGTSEIARAEISTEKLVGMVKRSASAGPQMMWTPEHFGEPIQLIPRGRIWLRAAPLNDEEFHQTFLQELTAC